MASSVPPYSRFPLAFALLAACLSSHALAQSRPISAPTQREPVLVELFTSEGCSDCPPADALLGRLDATQFVPGAQAIVLSEHVTYWNHLGWRDPFSLDAMDERQRLYSLHFSLNDVYTPQMVVDGSQQLVGGDSAALNRAVAVASHTPKLQIDIKDARLAAGTVGFSVLASSRTNTTLVVALAESATHSEPSRGENAGRTLHHVSVVRVLNEFDPKVTDGRPLRVLAPTPTTSDKPTGPLRLVVFLADQNTGHVLGVAQQIIDR